MSRRRFIADEVSADRAALVGAHAAHLVRVLRARVGQEFDIAANGRVRRGQITRIDNERVEFALAEDVPAVAVAEVTLLLAIFKFDRLEWAIEKCTELGAARIVPLIAARTDAHLAAAAEKRVERWRRLARQASEQSRRSTPPEIAAPIKLGREALALEGVRIVLAESERQLMLRDALRSAAGARTTADSTPAPGHVALAIGAEGGWTNGELKLFADAGWTNASLGNTILRAETAAIAALAIVMAEAT
jgi:16S rRNA (uracil1498-N3)-methyltransferase